MLFEKLIKQHRIHRFVTDGIRLAFLIASDEVGIHLRHLLSHEAKLWNLIRIKLLLVAKAHWFERKDAFARLVHGLNIVFEARRGGGRAEMTSGIDDYPDASCSRDSINTRDIGVLVSWFRADADLGRLASDTTIADVDIVTAGGESSTGSDAQSDVVAAGGVAKEGIMTAGCVVSAACVAKERLQAIGRVVAAVDVAVERAPTVGRVPDARCVAIERLRTVGRVEAALCIAIERVKTAGRVVGPAGVTGE